MTQQNPLGVIHNTGPFARRTDYLYRISLKAFIRNKNDELLVVKEMGRTYWDLPGGGMDHGEDIKTALTRELKEEINLSGDFTYKVITVEESAYVESLDLRQVRVIFEVKPELMKFSVGDDGDAIAFINPQEFENSNNATERHFFEYYKQLVR